MRVCGKNILREVEPKKVRKVILSNHFSDQELMNKIKNEKLKYMTMDQKTMDAMMPHNQGVIIEMDDFEYASFEEITGNFVVILDHLEDPHNFGAIIRTCEARGIKEIIIPKDRGVLINDTVMKTSAGALNHVRIILVTNLHNTIEKLKEQGYFIYGAEADGIDYRKVDYAKKIALVIGSEGNGLSRLVKKDCDEIISIPMKGKVNSLNASVAGAILIYGIGDQDA